MVQRTRLLHGILKMKSINCKVHIMSEKKYPKDQLQTIADERRCNSAKWCCVSPVLCPCGSQETAQLHAALSRTQPQLLTGHCTNQTKSVLNTFYLHTAPGLTGLAICPYFQGSELKVKELVLQMLKAASDPSLEYESKLHRIYRGHICKGQCRQSSSRETSGTDLY